jgi:PKD domain
VKIGLGTTKALNLSVAADGNALAVWGAEAAGYVYSATRSAASGRWTAPSPLRGSENVCGYECDVALGADKAGDAVALWQAHEPAGNNVVRAALRPAHVARWTEAADFGSGFALTVAVDGHGNVLAAWESGTFVGSGFDDASELHPGGPILFTQIPSNAAAGKRVRFVVTPAAWGASLVGKPKWDFGDGSSAHGNAIKHAYRRPGVYTVAVTDTDASGHSSTAAETIRIRRARSRSGH